jgi:hypothetical protein
MYNTDVLPHSFVSLEDYIAMAGDSVEDTLSFQSNVISAINYTTVLFERFCNRKLKARDFSFDPESVNFDEAYTVFDGPAGFNFYFPTYPVNEVYSFFINGEQIPESQNYLGTDGYLLYKNKGLIKYNRGFHVGYWKNVKVNWNGGYTENSPEYMALKHMSLEMVKTIMNMPKNTNLQSEKIGNYAYTLLAPNQMKELKGVCPHIFSALGMYRKEVV